MSILKDVVDGLSIIATGIRDINEIAHAVRDGKNYIEAKHPQIKPPLLAMMDELRKTTSAIAHGSGLLTHFRFGAEKPGEAARFNDYAIALKGKASDMEAQIDILRGHCTVIRNAASSIVMGTLKGGPLTAMFSIFGLASPKREHDLGVKLDKLAFEETHTANAAVRMVECLNLAVKDVLDTLGGGGLMVPANIPQAGALLERYADEFEKLEVPAKKAASQIAQLASELQS